MAATQAAGTSGVAHVSRALKLDYNGLKQRVNGGEPDFPQTQSATAFVQLEMNNPLPRTDCVVVEVEEPSGAKMTIRFGTGDKEILPSLVEVFGRQRQ